MVPHNRGSLEGFSDQVHTAGGLALTRQFNVAEFKTPYFVLAVSVITGATIHAHYKYTYTYVCMLHTVLCT